MGALGWTERLLDLDLVLCFFFLPAIIQGICNYPSLWMTAFIQHTGCVCHSLSLPLLLLLIMETSRGPARLGNSGSVFFYHSVTLAMMNRSRSSLGGSGREGAAKPREACIHPPSPHQRASEQD